MDGFVGRCIDLVCVLGEVRVYWRGLSRALI